MSRFLPKLFLRSRPKPILAPLHCQPAGREISAIWYSAGLANTRLPTTLPSSAVKLFQRWRRDSKFVFCIQEVGGHSQSRTLHCGSSRAGMEFVCVEGQYCPRARMAVPNIPHFNYLAALSTNQQRSRGRVGSCLLSGYNPTICSLTSTP